MSELRVVAQIVAKPGSEEIIRTALAALVAASRSDAGCISYELFDSMIEPGTFFTIENWASQADVDAHMSAPHVAAAFAAAGDHVAAAPAIHPLTPVAC